MAIVDHNGTERNCFSQIRNSEREHIIVQLESMAFQILGMERHTQAWSSAKNFPASVYDTDFSEFSMQSCFRNLTTK